MQALRTCTWLEGSSYLTLLLVAMPLKYWLGLPLAVRIVGSVHGALFVAFVILLIRAAYQQRWSLKRAALFFAASLIPGSMWWMERQLQK